MVCGGIPLHKLELEGTKHFFKEIKHECPSRNSCSQLIPDLYAEKIAEIKAQIVNQNVFAIVHETMISGTKYVNVLVESLSLNLKKPG